MTTIKRLLHVSGFTDKFIKLLDENSFSMKNKISYQKGSLTVVDEPNLLRLVLQDFTKNTTTQSKSLSFTITPLDSLDPADIDELFSKDERKKIFTVGPGVHVHKIHTHLMLCIENVELVQVMSTFTPKFLNRIAIISTTSDVQHIQNYIQTLKVNNGVKKHLKIFVPSDYSWLETYTNPRKSNTLFIGDLWNTIYDDAKEFVSKESIDWYTTHNIPYSRKYIMHGDPGNGKSATIRTLASELDMPLYCLNLTSAKMDDTALIQIVRDVEKGSIIAIEDIDRVFDHFTTNVSSSQVSYSTLLNILDGSIAKEGNIIIMTCNNFDLMDDAIKRCGRVDRLFEFKNANSKQVTQMFLSFYPDRKQEARNFSKTIQNISTVPMATVQEFFIRNRKRKAEEIPEMDMTLFKQRRTKNQTGTM
jgi:Cdc6-like AAA superfamily ATPase